MNTKIKKSLQLFCCVLLMAGFVLPPKMLMAQTKVENIKNKTSVKARAGNNKRTSVNNRKKTYNRKDNVRRPNINSGNNTVNINVDRSKDIRINNSRNTTVRRNTYRPYTRPPYRYGGRRYSCYRPYRYHPYRPFAWGPRWHPWGFFINTLAKTAIIISISNQKYHYDEGVYYMASNGGYTVVQAPVGAVITTLPPASQTVAVTETVNNYYYGGTFYEKSDKGYTVVPPTAGTTIENLPEGGKEEKIGDQIYVKIGETYYQPVEVDGKSMYEVAQVEEDK